LKLRLHEPADVASFLVKFVTRPGCLA
jgi:hypothetical protein